MSVLLSRLYSCRNKGLERLSDHSGIPFGYTQRVFWPGLLPLGHKKQLACNHRPLSR